MVTQHLKGDRRLKLDSQRIKVGEPNGNWKRNRDRNSRYPKDGVAFRNKGRARFKTGKKTKRAWGRHANKVIGRGWRRGRGQCLKTLMGPLDCLRINEDGSPCHPLYLPKSLQPIPFNYARV